MLWVFPLCSLCEDIGIRLFFIKLKVINILGLLIPYFFGQETVFEKYFTQKQQRIFFSIMSVIQVCDCYIQ